jgi:hypothetical protein
LILVYTLQSSDVTYIDREIQDNASSVLYRSMEEVESLQDSSTLYTQHQHFT